MRKIDRTAFRRVRCSVSDLVGSEYVEAVVAAAGALRGGDARLTRRALRAKVDFYPAAMQRRLIGLLGRVGTVVAKPFRGGASGAGTRAFEAATVAAQAPVAGLGWYRVGEDGRLYLISKSEHYHASLGHSFPGYRLLEAARAAGVPNATHNNTRGHITRRLEEELIRTANGGSVPRGKGLSRVLNVETGSLAVESALKMIMARFYRVHPGDPMPAYGGRIPVIFVMGDRDGGHLGNYHGTTVLTQLQRGMWPELRCGMESGGLLRVVPIKPNDIAGIEAAFGKHDRGRYKAAALFHEICMMNYGAKMLTRAFLDRAYALCRKHDALAVCDEIQSCLWSPRLYMFREYGLRPDFVTVGKGFPGGEYCASRLLINERCDVLPQFGALVTNGQEEIVSLAYLVTMRWARENADVTRRVGDRFEELLRGLADRHPAVVESVHGCRHLAGIHFHDMAVGKAFASALNRRGLDISIQTYKKACPPAALIKLPLICGYEAVDFVIGRMQEALEKG